MMTKISKETIIAVDVEANEWDGYTGMMCLIQISTHEENFILDCLSLPQEIKSKLKSVFESPSTLKVMHGCGNDLRWLQRDFQIFVWPVVDTQLIERKFGAVTGNENCGFAELTDRYLHIKITKEEKVLGQFSDYRSRPLHQDLILYAVNDSRLLIQVWEHQKQKFFGDGLTISKSKDLQIMMSQLAFSSLFAGQKPVSSHPTATSTHDTQILHNIKNVREKLAIKLNLPVQLIGSDSVISGAIKAGTPPNKVHPVFREILKTGWPSKSFALPQTTPKATTTCMRLVRKLIIVLNINM
jgi:ribonuclease D